MEEEQEAALIADIDTLGEHIRHLVDKLESRARTQGDVDARAVATARTQLQGGFKWLRDAVRKPAAF